MYDLKDNLKKNLIDKYKKFKINDNIYDLAVNYAYSKEGNLIKIASLYIENYIISTYDLNAKEILHNEFMYLKLREVAKKNTTNLDNIYNDAINNLNEYYNPNLNFQSNISQYLASNIKKEKQKETKPKRNVRYTNEDKIKSESSSISYKYSVGDGYDISFLKNFFSSNHILNNDIAKIFNLDISYVYQCLNFGRKINDKQLSNLLEHLNANSFEELKDLYSKNKLKFYRNIEEKEKNEKEEKIVNNSNIEEYDIRFLKPWMKLNKIYEKDISEILDISSSIIFQYFSGVKIRKINKIQLQKLLDYFNVNSYEELILKSKSNELKYKKNNKNSQNLNINYNQYNLKFLKPYMDSLNISTSSLAYALNCSTSTVLKYLNGSKKLMKDDLPILLNFFGVDKFDDLVSRVLDFFDYDSLDKFYKSDIIKTKKSKPRGKSIKNNYDISFLKKYLKVKKIKRATLADILNVKVNTLSLYLNGNKIPQKNLDLLLKYFNKENIDELRQMVLDEFNVKSIEELNDVKVDDNTNVDISFLKKYLIQKNYSLRKLSLMSNINYVLIYNYINGRKKVTPNQLNKLLNTFNVKSLDELKQMVLDEFNINSLEELENIEMTEYNVSFLRKYIEYRNIKYASLCNHLQLADSTLRYYIQGKRLIPYDKFKLLLEYFNKENIDELKQMVLDEFNINSLDELENVDVKNFKINTLNISFLRKYIESKHIKILEICDYIGIDDSSFRLCLNNKRNVTYSTYEKLLKYFNKENIDELRQMVLDEFNINSLDELDKVDVVVSKNRYKNVKSYDISFLKAYIRYSNISNRTLANFLSLNENTVSRYLNGKSEIAEDDLKLLLEYFNKENIDELKQMVLDKFNVNSLDELESISIPYKSNDSNKTNIKFLKEYLKKEKITYNELSNILGVSISTISNYLTGFQELPEYKLKLLLEYFNKENVDELKQMVLDKFNVNSLDELDNISPCYSYNIEFLKEYLKKEKITYDELSNILDMSIGTISKCLNGLKKLPEYKLKLLLEYFNKENIDELKQMVLGEEEIKEEIKINNEKLNLINERYLMLMLINKGLKGNDLLIAKFVYDNLVEKKYSDEKISELFNISVIKVLEIKKICLNIYKEECSNIIENEIKYVYKRMGDDDEKRNL